MKLQDKLEGLATTALERRVIRLWLREGRARSSFARALGKSRRASEQDTTLDAPRRDGLSDSV